MYQTKEKKDMYKIGDFSYKVDIPIKTLRYYDEIDLFKPSYQDYFTGYRYYESTQISKIEEIKRLKDLDLSLKEIKEYLETNDINILLKKEKEFVMKIESIKDYINKNNQYYKIILILVIFINNKNWKKQKRIV